MFRRNYLFFPFSKLGVSLFQPVCFVVTLVDLNFWQQLGIIRTDAYLNLWPRNEIPQTSECSGGKSTCSTRSKIPPTVQTLFKDSLYFSPFNFPFVCFFGFSASATVASKLERTFFPIIKIKIIKRIFFEFHIQYNVHSVDFEILKLKNTDKHYVYSKIFKNMSKKFDGSQHGSFCICVRKKDIHGTKTIFSSSLTST